MVFHACMSAIQVEGRHTATHQLDGILWLHVSGSNGAQDAHSNSQAGLSFMAACQQFKWSPGGTQQLTGWMEFHGWMSAIQMEPMRHTATHILDGISWLDVTHSNGAQDAHSNSPTGISRLDVSHSNGAQKTHSNSHPGWDFMAGCQPFKWSPGGTQQLTSWMEFHGWMLAIQMEPRRCTATHSLDGISWLDVSHENGAQEGDSNSPTGWNFMTGCQQFRWSPGGTQQLTPWMEFHGWMSAIQMEPWRHTATHNLDGISWLHVNNSNRAQEVHNSHSRH